MFIVTDLFQKQLNQRQKHSVMKMEAIDHSCLLVKVSLLLILIGCGVSIASAQKQSQTPVPGQARILMQSQSSWDEFDNALINPPTTSTSPKPKAHYVTKNQVLMQKYSVVMQTLENELLTIIDEHTTSLDQFLENKLQDIQAFQESKEVPVKALLDDVVVRLEKLEKEIPEQKVLSESQKVAEKGVAEIALNLVSTLDSILNSTIEIYPEVGFFVRQISAFKNGKAHSNQLDRRSLDVSKCGGVVVSDKGDISYSPDLEEYTPGLQCLWTIRVPDKTRMRIELTQENFDSKTKLEVYYLPSAPLNYFGLLTMKKASGDIGIEGPLHMQTKIPSIINSNIAFVLLSAGSQQIPEFNLKFQAVGVTVPDNSSSSSRYLHYHLSESEGSVSYPTQPASFLFYKSKFYKGPETVTYTIQPQLTGVNRTVIYLHDLDLPMGFSEECDGDSLVFFGRQENGKFVPIYGESVKRKMTDRYCGRMTEEESIETAGKLVIAVFKSDILFGGKGFTFSWKLE